MKKIDMSCYYFLKSDGCTSQSLLLSEKKFAATYIK